MLVPILHLTPPCVLEACKWCFFYESDYLKIFFLIYTELKSPETHISVEKEK